MTRTLLTRVAVVLVVALAFGLAAAPAFAAAPNPVVSGTLTGSDGVGIPDQTVSVSVLVKGVYRPSGSATTDASGYWSYTAKAGDYRYDFAGVPSADPAFRLLTMERGQAYTLDVELASFGTIGGTIASASDGAGLNGASVEFYRRNGDGTWPTAPYATATAGAGGVYTSATLPCGMYAVKASNAGFLAQFLGGSTIDLATPVAVLRAQTAAANIALAPAPTPDVVGINGKVVTGAAQTPLPNAFIWLYKQNPDGSWPPTTPGWGSPTLTVFPLADGTYSTGALAAGNYRVRFFEVHFGSQWWMYVPTVDLAVSLTIDDTHPGYEGIDGWFNKP